MKLLPDKPDLRENGRCKARIIEEMGRCVNYQESEGMHPRICKHIVLGRYEGGECRIYYAAKEVVG